MSLNLKEKIKQDTKESLLARDAVRSGPLRMLQAAIRNSEINKRAKLSKSGVTENLDEAALLNDEETMAVIKSEVKKVKDSIEQFGQGNRQDLVDQSKKELAILEVYLPAQMPEEEVRKIVKEVIGEFGASGVKEMGKVIGAAMKKINGQADGTLVSKIVKEELGN